MNQQSGSSYDNQIPKRFNASSAIPVRSKPSVRYKLVDRNRFTRRKGQGDSFQYIEDAIINNTMAGTDPETRYDLAIDTSKSGIMRGTFQLQDSPPGTEVTD